VAAAKPLLLTAADGPWNWRRTHYELFRGPPADPHAVSIESSLLARMVSLGSMTAVDCNESGRMEFCFADENDEPLLLLGTSYDNAGVGHRVWDSALALALFQRSTDMPTLKTLPRVLELGAGVGLPGFELGRRMEGGARVTLTDSRPALVDLLRRNTALVTGKSKTSYNGVPGWIEVAGLEWGSGGRMKDGIFFEEDWEDSIERLSVNSSLAFGDDKEGNDNVQYDLVLGSDICYLREDVPDLVRLLLRLRAPVSILIAPFSRPSFDALRDALLDIPCVEVDERILTLACAEADVPQPTSRTRPCTVHRLLIVRHT